MIEINLLPKEYKKRGPILSFDKKLMYVVSGGVAVVLVLAVLTFFQNYQMNSLDKMITKAQIEEGRYKKDIAIIDALTEVKEKILERLDAVERLDRRRDFHVRFLEELNRRIPEFLWLTSLSEQPPGLVGGAPKATPGGNNQAADTLIVIDPSTGQAVMEGYAYSLNSVGSFMVALMKSDYFDNIKLGRAAQEDVAKLKAYNFRITADLNYDATDFIEELEDMPDDNFRLSAKFEDDEL